MKLVTLCITTACLLVLIYYEKRAGWHRDYTLVLLGASLGVGLAHSVLGDDIPSRVYAVLTLSSLGPMVLAMIVMLIRQCRDEAKRSNRIALIAFACGLPGVTVIAKWLLGSLILGAR